MVGYHLSFCLTKIQPLFSNKLPFHSPFIRDTSEGASQAMKSSKSSFRFMDCIRDTASTAVVAGDENLNGCLSIREIRNVWAMFLAEDAAKTPIAADIIGTIIISQRIASCIARRCVSFNLIVVVVTV